MKKIILLILAVLPELLFAQQTCTIKGQVGAANALAKVFLIYDKGDSGIAEQATIKNGEFEFICQVSDITLARLIMDYKGTGLNKITGKPDMLTLFLEQGTISVFSPDSLSTAKLEGTKANEDLVRYLSATKPVRDETIAINAEYNAAPAEKKNSQAFVQTIQKKQQVNLQKTNDINNRFIAENPDAYISLQVLTDRVNAENYPDATALETQFSKLSANLRESKEGRACLKKIDRLKTLKKGALKKEGNDPIKKI